MSKHVSTTFVFKMDFRRIAYNVMGPDLWYICHVDLTKMIQEYMSVYCAVCRYDMMTSSNGNIFRVTGPLCGEFTGPGDFPAQRPVTRSFDVFFDLRLNKRLNKQSWGWWFETVSRPFWRNRNDPITYPCPTYLLLANCPWKHVSCAWATLISEKSKLTWL